jgi:hypothetical protein
MAAPASLYAADEPAVKPNVLLIFADDKDAEAWQQNPMVRIIAGSTAESN